MWMTNVTMQADGAGKPDRHACAIDQFRGLMRAEGKSHDDTCFAAVAPVCAGKMNDQVRE